MEKSPASDAILDKASFVSDFIAARNIYETDPTVIDEMQQISKDQIVSLS
jgi:hypothetical protein